MLFRSCVSPKQNVIPTSFPPAPENVIEEQRFNGWRLVAHAFGPPSNAFKGCYVTHKDREQTTFTIAVTHQGQMLVSVKAPRLNVRTGVLYGFSYAFDGRRPVNAEGRGYTDKGLSLRDTYSRWGLYRTLGAASEMVFFINGEKVRVDLGRGRDAIRALGECAERYIEEYRPVNVQEPSPDNINADYEPDVFHTYYTFERKNIANWNLAAFDSNLAGKTTRGCYAVYKDPNGVDLKISLYDDFRLTIGMTAKVWNVDEGDHQYTLYYSFDDEFAQVADARISGSDSIFIVERNNTEQLSKRLKKAHRATFIYKNKVVSVDMQATDTVAEELFDCILRYKVID